MGWGQGNHFSYGDYPHLIKFTRGLGGEWREILNGMANGVGHPTPITPHYHSYMDALPIQV